MKRRRKIGEQALCKMLKALSSPNRMRIFNEIRGAGETKVRRGHDCSLNKVIAHLGLGPSIVSHHLSTLVNAGLVTTEKDGKFVKCRVDREQLESLAQYFTEAAQRAH